MTIPLEALVVWGAVALLLFAGALALGFLVDRRQRGSRSGADLEKFRDIVETSPDLITRMNAAGEPSSSANPQWYSMA